MYVCMYKMRAKRARSFKSMGQKTGQLRLICTSQRELNWPEERLTVMLSVDCRATSSYLHDNLALCLLINHVSYLKCGSYPDLWHILWQLFWKNCTTYYMIYTIYIGTNIQKFHMMVDFWLNFILNPQTSQKPNSKPQFQFTHCRWVMKFWSYHSFVSWRSIFIWLVSCCCLKFF